MPRERVSRAQDNSKTETVISVMNQVVAQAQETGNLPPQTVIAAIQRNAEALLVSAGYEGVNTVISGSFVRGILKQQGWITEGNTGVWQLPEYPTSLSDLSRDA